MTAWQHMQAVRRAHEAWRVATRDRRRLWLAYRNAVTAMLEWEAEHA